MNPPKVLYSTPQCAGKKFAPSNGTEGEIFRDAFCLNCIHEKWLHTGNDNDAKCEILSASMMYDVDDKRYPSEWVYGDDGYPVCTAWKYWDWGGRNGDDLNDPPPPPVNDPDQLVMPFIVDDILGDSKRGDATVSSPASLMATD